MRCCLPFLRPAAFPPPSPPPISVGFVRCFNGTTQPSDSSSVPRQLRLLDFLSRPGIAQATAGQTRSPRFRRDPSVRDVASDPGRATVPRITAPHMLPSPTQDGRCVRLQSGPRSELEPRLNLVNDRGELVARNSY